MSISVQVNGETFEFVHCSVCGVELGRFNHGRGNLCRGCASELDAAVERFD